MHVKDHHGLALSGASVTAAENFRGALQAYHCYAGDAPGQLQAALNDSPAFVMGHVLNAWMNLLGGNAQMAMDGAAAFEAARGLAADTREQGHLAALGRYLSGDVRASARILEDVAIAHPRDALALQIGQTLDFLLGDSRMLRDRIGRALPAWSPELPDYHAILGMHAFGLEETGLYDRAEAAGREAVAREPRNNWAQHAVAHVLEMQDRRREGVTWMLQDGAPWAHESFFAVHNWWHLALFHLGLGEINAVYDLLDGPVFGARSDAAFDMVDAASLLWRLQLRGLDVGERWHALAAIYDTQPRGLYAFDDAHAMMAYVGAGRMAEAQALLDLQAQVIAGPGDNAYFAGDVGLPVMQAIHAFGTEDFARCVELLRGVRNRAARFGGSHAQRDLIDLTLIAAAGNAGEYSLEQALLAERAEAKPRVTDARRLAA